MQTTPGRVSGHFTGAEKDDLFELLIEISRELKKIAGHLETFEKEREGRRIAAEKTARMIQRAGRIGEIAGELDS